MVSAGLFRHQCGHQKKRRRGQIARYAQLPRLKVRTAGYGDGTFLDIHVRSKLPQRQLGVVARADRLVHGRAAIGVKPGQQNAAFYLGTRYRQRVFDGVELGSVNDQRRKAPITGFDACAHFLQRLHDALHGPPGERFVAADPALEGLRGQNAGEHTDGRAGIAGVQHAGRLTQSVETMAVNTGDSIPLLDFGAQRPHAGERGLAIRAGRIIRNFGSAFGDRRQHRVTMGDGFVAGKLDRAADSTGRRDLLAHGKLECSVIGPQEAVTLRQPETRRAARSQPRRSRQSRRSRRLPRTRNFAVGSSSPFRAGSGPEDSDPGAWN